MNSFINNFVFFIFISAASARIFSNFNKYFIDRNNLFEEESCLSFGSQIELTQDENRANEVLMHWKWKEVDESFKNPQHYNFSKHFFAYKNDINKSNVYQIIKKMPKGAALHIHDVMMLDVDSLMKFTYEEHLYACYSDDYLKFQFSDTVPTLPCQFKWNLLSDLRNTSENVTTFDLELRKHLTLFTEDQQMWNTDINVTWMRLLKVTHTINRLIQYRPVREKYFYESLKNFYNDNVLYVELRNGLYGMYELNGTVHNPMYIASLFQKVTKNFINKHPDFVGIKLILSPGRSVTVDKIQAALEIMKELKNEMPHLIAGFDLVSQEDKGKPLLDFLPALIKAKDEINFYFHAGETNWFGTTSDENLIDAVLLGSKRIGHAYALTKHPMVLAAVKEKDIAIEVNVISNVVLSLVRDVRNHPLASYLALGLPVVLSSDDPGAWGADPLSHDFYVAFVGIASRNADIRMLKQLALNSIKYSALDDNGKRKLYDVFTRKWNVFINDVIASNYE